MVVRWQFYGFQSKDAARNYIRDYLKSKRLYEEFYSPLFSLLFYKHHYKWSELKTLPSRFRKVKSQYGHSGYDFQAYFPALGEWVDTSWTKCIDGVTWERKEIEAMRLTIAPIMRKYREEHPWCERCLSQPASEVDHVEPEFAEIVNQARQFITPEDRKRWKEITFSDPHIDFVTILGDHPLKTFLLDIHKRTRLMAVCRDCHLLNAKERKGW